MSHQWITTCLAPERWMDQIARKMAVEDSGCHVWTGRLDRYGYARFTFRSRDGVRHQLAAHRAHWLAAVGDIPLGLVVDHLCRNRACLRLDHLELVTTRENIQRGHAGMHRKRGPGGCREHGRDDGYVATSNQGYARWVCRICRRERGRRFREAARA